MKKSYYALIVLLLIGTFVNINAQTKKAKLKAPNGKAIAVFAEGCFWCSEHIFEVIVGVEAVVSGYSGGQLVKPSYEKVCSELTGHAESVLVVYDPKKVSYTELVKVFFESHNSTTPNQEGNDFGPSYRSIAFYQTEQEKSIIASEIAILTASKKLKKPIITEVKKLDVFWIAENYHQNYVNLHPEESYVKNVSIPRFELFIKNYKGKLKK